MHDDAQVARTEKMRGGCLSAALVAFGGFSLVSVLINLGLSGRIASRFPNAPAWAPSGILVLGLLGLAAFAALVMIWKWRRAGLYLYVAVGLAVFAINVGIVGLTTALLGLTGVVVISILVAQQWSDFS
jgi:hypothetical protein